MFTIPTESLFTLNKFGNPKEVKNNEAIYTLITRLILLEPGTIQSHPTMGVGIVSRYRYSFEGSIRDLQNDISEQIQQFLPNFVGVQVKVTEKDRAYTIDVIIDDTLYKFSFNSEVGQLEAIRTT